MQKMPVDTALIYAQGRIKHYEDMAKLFKDESDERPYYEKNAAMLTALCDEIRRLRHELLVAVARAEHDYS